MRRMTKAIGISCKVWLLAGIAGIIKTISCKLDGLLAINYLDSTLVLKDSAIADLVRMTKYNKKHLLFDVAIIGNIVA